MQYSLTGRQNTQKTFSLTVKTIFCSSFSREKFLPVLFCSFQTNGAALGESCNEMVDFRAAGLTSPPKSEKVPAAVAFFVTCSVSE